MESSQEQSREKEEREANLIRQLRQTEEQRDNTQRELENCQEQLRGRDEQLERQTSHLREVEQQFERRIREKEEREANLIRQLRQSEEQRDNTRRGLENCQEQLRGRDEQLERQNSYLREVEQQFERQIREKEEERANLERRLMLKDQELNELETTLSAAQQAAISEQRRQETCDWVILRDEIHVTDKFLGRGGWGSVNEGTYCGCTVAVKQIHYLILSPHNRRLFEREMNIASRCRHPCLLQFIGATNDEGSPLFVTELMETSLRALLEQHELSETEIRVISLDVACALNYLHQKKPFPIIHRDISSANVLLWRQGDQWRGKVSDYGTANFMQQTMTVAPGAMIYIAPEALTPNQTIKVGYDWYYTVNLKTVNILLGEQNANYL